MSSQSRVTLVAEVATGHGGNIELAKRFVQEFAAAGADIIKFQLTRVKHLRPDDPQFDWFTQAEISLDGWSRIQEECARNQVGCLWTIYHPDEIALLGLLGASAVKVGSGEAGDTRLANAILVAQGLDTVYVSGGITPINVAYRKHPGLKELGCVTRYPAGYGLAVQKLTTQVLDGWSDHAVGLHEARAAISLGTRIIERHVCLRQQARPCREWESYPSEWRELRDYADLDPKRFLGRWTL